jgi:hypothetical protein
MSYADSMRRPHAVSQHTVSGDMEMRHCGHNYTGVCCHHSKLLPSKVPALYT